MQIVIKQVNVQLDTDAVYNLCNTGGIFPSLLHKHINFDKVVGDVQAQIDALNRKLDGELLYLNYDNSPSYEDIVDDIERFLLDKGTLGDFKNLRGILKICRINMTIKNY